MAGGHGGRPRCPAQRGIVWPAAGCPPRLRFPGAGRVEALLKSPFMPGSQTSAPARGAAGRTEPLSRHRQRGKGSHALGPTAQRGCGPTPWCGIGHRGTARGSVAQPSAATGPGWELLSVYGTPCPKHPKGPPREPRGVCPHPQLPSIPIPVMLHPACPGCPPTPSLPASTGVHRHRRTHSATLLRQRLFSLG